MNIIQTAILNGQSLQSLHADRNELLDIVAESADGPSGISTFFWLCSHTNYQLADELAIKLLWTCRDPSTMAEIVDFIPEHELRSDLLKNMGHVFTSRAADKENTYGIRAQALYGALIVAQSQKGILHYLKGFVLDLDNGDDPHFLRHASRIIGLLQTYSPETEFRKKLEEFLVVPEAKDEAAMELGKEALRCGIGSESQEVASQLFEEALQWFYIAKESSESRVDAYLYSLCLEVLVKIQKDGFGNNPVSYIDQLAKASWTYSAYLGSSVPQQPAWMGAQSSERLHWTLLASKLSIMDLQFRKTVWINAAQIIEAELIAIFYASRSIFCFGKETGIDYVIRPKLSTSFCLQRRHLDELDQWIEENRNSPLLPDAETMRTAIDCAREDSVLHRPFVFGGADQALQVILDAGQVPTHARQSIAALLQTSYASLGPSENPILSRIVIDIVEKMAGNYDYATLPGAQSLFSAILIQSVYFLSHRHDTGTESDPSASYLFRRRPEKLPLENELQQDYYRFMRMSGLRDHVQLEFRNLGAGRSDVNFMAAGINVVIEVKRTFKDMNHDSLVDTYGFQTTAYQTSNVRFCFLLVLDLWDRVGSQPHISEQISLQRKVPPGQEAAYDIVVMRVQGQRKTPSQLPSLT